MTKEFSRIGVATAVALVFVLGAVVVWWQLHDGTPVLSSPSHQRAPAPATRSETVLPTVVIEEPSLHLVSPVVGDGVQAELTPDEGDTEAVLPALPYVARDGYPARMFVDPAFFEERYGEQSLDDLHLARIHLGDEIAREQHDAVNEYFDHGGGTQQVIGRAERDAMRPGDHDSAPPVPPHERGLVRGARSVVLPDGSVLMTKGAVPWAEYSSFYDRQDELFRLIEEIGRRKASLASVDG